MNILFLPHAVEHTYIINRSHEFATLLQSFGHTVYFATWRTSSKEDSLTKKLKDQLWNFLYYKHQKTVALSYIKLPIVKVPKKSAFIRRFNAYIVNRFVKRQNIDCIICSNVHFYDLSKINCPIKAMDLVDDHLSVNPTIGIDKRTVDLQLANCESADIVFTVSHLVEQKLSSLLPSARQTLTLANGFYLDRFTNTVQEDIQTIRRSLGIKPKTKTIGYIGNIDHWVSLETALSAFKQAFPTTDNCVFIVVGACQDEKYYVRLKAEYSQQNIVFVGGVKKEKVHLYFQLLDIGIIPFIKSDFTDNAFPIKALEYAAGKASIISRDLSFLEKQSFPFVHFFSDESDIIKLFHTLNGLTEVPEEIKPFQWHSQAKLLEASLVSLTKLSSKE